MRPLREGSVVFVTFEGPEGSGKTTQIALLERALHATGRRVVATREPGGTPIGEQIRAVLHAHENVALVPAAEILLYAADRAQHVREVVVPALQRGDIVLSDRYAESTLAYQGYGRGLDMEALRHITAFATGGLRPDLVIYLDLDVELGLQRKRRAQALGRGEWNRMDEQATAFHQRVRTGYLTMAAEDPERWLVIDATRSIEAVHRVIYERIETML